jgi:hypothetical protein
MSLDIFSALNSANRFGINSPKSMERNVTMITTIVSEMPSA